MSTNPDLFADRIHHSVNRYSEDEYDVLRCRLSKECDAVFADRKFVQKLNSLFQE
ncbi:hypothetical protein L1S32_10010 [Methanogenium sp. S4BF]|uniref:hypothetical protein n=1 Tax=Methanogenium sp. S4BF TaxID=1789226 RepID=UPI002416FFF5|nr:hypothetical protein [Methanogenium sp. S4BF]WFN34167.1 hypothetical protein L1S32_10010 [Methanogenium sp. S4BF]